VSGSCLCIPSAKFLPPFMVKVIPLVLRATAALLLAGVVILWVVGGAHQGWSMNRVPLTKTDEITGIDYVEYEDRFVAGLEVLAGGTGGAVLLFGLSFLFRKPTSNLKPTP